MNRNTTLFLIILLSLATHAQRFTNPFYHIEIDTNNISAGLNANASLFWDFNNAQFRVPKAGRANAVFEAGLWIAGYDQGGNLHACADQYGHGYLPGSYAVAFQSPIQKAKWNMIWTIRRSEVLAAKIDYDLNQTITQPVSDAVLTWPARGNIFATGADGDSIIITENMAPFYDRNSDSIYNPFDGDYPMMRGDKMMWWVCSDSVDNRHNRLGVELHISAYEYASDIDTTLNNSLFMSFEVVNRSQNNYDSLLIGKFVDHDFGCSENDRIGSIPAQNTFYVYNGIHGVNLCDDGNACLSGITGYNCTNPILTTTFLNQTMTSFDQFSRNGGASEGDPIRDIELYNYLNARWKDGNPLVFGGDGRTGTSIPCRFLFPGNPADSTEWSEIHPLYGYPIAANDRRDLGSVGPFSLQSGGSIVVDMVYIFNPSFGSSIIPDITPTTTAYIDSITAHYAAEDFPAWFDSSKILTLDYTYAGLGGTVGNEWFKTTPNPNNGNFTLTLADVHMGTYKITISDLQGRTLYTEDVEKVSDKHPVDVSNLQPGVYHIAVESAGQRLSKALMLN